MGVGIKGGNVIAHWIVQSALTPASVAANGATEQTFALVGVKPGDFVDTNKPTAQAGLAIGRGRAGGLAHG